MIDHGRNTYRVIWKDKFKISYGYLKNDTFFAPIRKIWRKAYSGYVYNIEVEQDNSYVTKSFVVHNCRGLHAEQNAIIQASLYGVSVKESVMYITNQPCIICTKMLINAGIKEIIISNGYPDKMAMDFLKEAAIRVRLFKE
jgi:deoxycytidylate deaminase